MINWQAKSEKLEIEHDPFSAINDKCRCDNCIQKAYEKLHADELKRSIFRGRQ